MSILVNENTRVIIQGITGREGSLHTKLMLKYGTKIVAGVTPGKGGLNVYGVPVYDSVEEAIKKNRASVSIVFVPALYASDAIYEAIDAKKYGLKLIIVITEHIPIHDSIKFINYARLHNVKIIGPNSPGIIVPDKCKLGIMPARFFKKGNIALVSRSGTLTYEIAYELNRHGYGISTAIGLGGDPIVGIDMLEAILLLEKDRDTKCIVLIGEIGGDMEERVAEYIYENNFSKPIIAFIAGKTAPSGKRMGHAGAIIIGSRGTAKSKIKSFKKAGIEVAEKISDIPSLIEKLF
ncbi:MAG TPA: succinate--CoA ligase subunit alpha [Thermoprotei archaeon]|nr:succinate--CoA ligase subunit alpha [Thermoprotei archaeon]